MHNHNYLGSSWPLTINCRPQSLTEDVVSSVLQMIDEEQKRTGATQSSEPLAVQVAACIVSLCGWAARWDSMNYEWNLNNTAVPSAMPEFWISPSVSPPAQQCTPWVCPFWPAHTVCARWVCGTFTRWKVRWAMETPRATLKLQPHQHWLLPQQPSTRVRGSTAPLSHPLHLPVVWSWGVRTRHVPSRQVKRHWDLESKHLKKDLLNK